MNFFKKKLKIRRKTFWPGSNAEETVEEISFGEILGGHSTCAPSAGPDGPLDTGVGAPAVEDAEMGNSTAGAGEEQPSAYYMRNESEIQDPTPQGLEVNEEPEDFARKQPGPEAIFLSMATDKPLHVLTPSKGAKKGMQKTSLPKAQKKGKTKKAKEYYAVERIVRQRGDDFLVKWKGWRKPTWEPRKHIPLHIIDKFISQTI